MSTAPAQPGATVEFTLQPYRRPLRLPEALILLATAAALFSWVGGALYVWLHLGRWIAVLGAAAAVALMVTLNHRARHRRYPAGNLRLGPDGLRVDDGLRVRLIPYGELRYLLGTGLGLQLKGAGRAVLIDWPRFSPRTPREAVERILARVAAEESGAQVLQRTAQLSRRTAGFGRIIFWVCIGNGVLLLLRLLSPR